MASTARPSAPPIWAVVLTSPEASPAWLRLDAVHGQPDQRREAGAGAEAEQRHRSAAAGSRSRRRPARRRAAPSATAISTSPASDAVRGAEAGDQPLEYRTDSVPMQIVTGRKARPICSAS